MPPEKTTQEVTQDLAQVIGQALASATEKQTTLLSELLNTMKGAVSTTSTHVREDVNGTEAIQHASAMIPLNSKFWFDIVALQATAMNAELLKSLNGWNEIVQRHARNGVASDHKDSLAMGCSKGE